MSDTATESQTVLRRRISWAELYRQRPDLRPANDDREREAAA